MNDKDVRSWKLLKLKYSRETKKFSRSAELVPPKKLGPPSLIRRNFKTLTKVLLNHAECIEI